VGYRELDPPAALADRFVCGWIRDVDEPSTGRVLPDGCVDVVWRDGSVSIAGPDTGPVLVPLRAGETLVGVRLHVGEAAALGVAAHELRDSRVPLDALWRDAGEVAERVAESGDRVATLEREVARRLRQAGDPLVAEAVGGLAQGADVGELSGRLGVSERRLQRRFRDHVGYAPKVLQRVMRLRRFMALAAGGGALAELAAAGGYADQAHLTRECRALTGLTPRALVDTWLRP
jgi:AraC-like DNA-binding protein